MGKQQTKDPERSTTTRIGRTGDGRTVWVTITLRGRDGETEFTNHERGPVPLEVSTVYAVSVASSRMFPQDLDTVSDNSIESWGQVPARERIIEHIAHNADAEFLALVAKLDDHHLNTMKAACDHMDETTVPDDVDDRMGWKLQNLVCPETGYQYGRAWLARRLPESLEEQVVALLGDPRKVGA